MAPPAVAAVHRHARAERGGGHRRDPEALAPLIARGARVVVADGGSTDDTLARARRFEGVEVIQAPRGRAAQMNAGRAGGAARRRPAVPARRHHAAAGRRSTHRAGARRGPAGLGPLRRAHRRARPDAARGGRLDEPALALERHRHRRPGDVHDARGVRRRRGLSRAAADGRHRAVEAPAAGCRRPACLRQRVTTSGRRWEARGVWPTIVLMWRLRWAYWRGASPQALARRYE